MFKPFNMILVITAIFLLLIGLYNYILFHVLVEIFCIMVGFSIYSIGWNAKHFIKNNNLLILSVSYLVISIFTMLHLVTIYELNIFPHLETNNISIHFWLISRTIECFTFLLVGFFIHENIKDFSFLNKYTPSIYALSMFLIFTIVTVARILSVHIYTISNSTYIKIGYEYLLSVVFALAAILFWKNKEKLNQEVFLLLFSSILISIPTNILFSFESLNKSFYYIAGHILKFISFFLVYKALVVDSLQKPYHNLFEQYSHSQKRLVATGSMISTLFHDLKNPLSTIKAISQIGSLKTNTEEAKDYFDRIEHKVNNISQMINRMLSTFKPEKPKTVNIIEVFQDIIGDINPICETKNINLIFHQYKSNKRLNVILEINLFKRAIKNLLHNAINVLGKNGKIEIEIKNSCEHILIKISDNGPGIPEKIQNTLFKPFVQVGNGTGLGLYMVYYTITTIHHGKIWYKTKENEGTTFYLEIPSTKN